MSPGQTEVLPWSLQSRLARSAGNGHSTGCSGSCTGSPDYSDTEAARGFFRSLLVVIDSLVPRLWQPVRSDALLKGFVVKVGGCLGLVRGGVYFQYFFFSSPLEHTSAEKLEKLPESRP